AVFVLTFMLVATGGEILGLIGEAGGGAGTAAADVTLEAAGGEIAATPGAGAAVEATASQLERELLRGIVQSQRGWFTRWFANLARAQATEQGPTLVGRILGQGAKAAAEERLPFLLFNWTS